MKIAVIPARGGSKRIPRKNIREFAGKPMIAYAIEAALKSGLFDHVIVSTDDDEIKQISEGLGAKIPFTRPAELADDHTPTVPVIVHALKFCKDLGWEIDYACCIYPGVPFIRIEDIKLSLEILQNMNVLYSFPVTEYPSAIQRALRRLPNSQMKPFYAEYELTRTQDLEKAYHDAGQFYWGTYNAWFTNNKIHSNGAGLLIPNWRVVDIDTPEDWERAEILYKALMKNEGL